jgi:hypothetical protein
MATCARFEKEILATTARNRLWHGVLVTLAAGKLAGVWFAARPAEPWHATVRAALSVAFALRAQRLRARAGA